jgi:hypothetical protein
MLIWVKLLGLPFEYWLYEVFKAIGNKLGIFYKDDMEFVDSGIMFIEKIIVV